MIDARQRIDPLGVVTRRRRVVGDARGKAMTHNEMLREFFLGFIKIHILHHAGEEPVYGLALISELRRHGYELSPGTLYPVLHQLEKAGYLRRLNRVVGGKVRKYYLLTGRGDEALGDARAKIAELVGEIIEPGVREGRARPERSRPRQRGSAPHRSHKGTRER